MNNASHNINEQLHLSWQYQQLSTNIMVSRRYHVSNIDDMDWVESSPKRVSFTSSRISRSDRSYSYGSESTLPSIQENVIDPPCRPSSALVVFSDNVPIPEEVHRSPRSRNRTKTRSQSFETVHTLTGDIPFFEERGRASTVLSPTRSNNNDRRSLSSKCWSRHGAVNDNSTLLKSQAVEIASKVRKEDNIYNVLAKESRKSKAGLHPTCIALKCCRKCCTTVATVRGSLCGGLVFRPLGLMAGEATAGEATNAACKKLERCAQRRREMKQVQCQASAFLKNCDIM